MEWYRKSWQSSPGDLWSRWTWLALDWAWLGRDFPLFFLATYGTLVVSASLGMAKALKVGPCRVLGDRGLLSGFLSHRFLLLCFFMLVGKAILIVLIFAWAVNDRGGVSNNLVAIPIVTFLAPTVPGIISACFFC